MAIFEVFNNDSEAIIAQKEAYKAIFEQGTRAYYKRDFETTIACMEQVLTHLPHDKISKLYLERAKRYNLQGVTANWDGVTKMDIK